jgi:hypothetical protein
MDAAEVAVLQEEVTQARVVVIKARARTTRSERMAQEKAALLAFARGEANEAAQMVSLLNSELAATCQAWIIAKGKFPDLVDRVVTTNQ